MADQDSIWFRLGYTLENARLGASPPPRLRSPAQRGAERRPERPEEPEAARKVAAARTRRPERGGGRAEATPDEADEADASPGGLARLLQGVSPGSEPWESAVTGLGAALVARLLDRMPRKRRPGPLRLLRAAAAGAGVALARELVRPLTSGREAPALPFAERARAAALSGSARGLLYGALVEPRLPGPSVLRGALYGTAEHLVAPLGGLTALAGARAPHRSLPFVAALFEGLEQGDETLVDHVLFGIGLAALYGARAADAAGGDEDEADED